MVHPLPPPLPTTQTAPIERFGPVRALAVEGCVLPPHLTVSILASLAALPSTAPLTPLPFPLACRMGLPLIATPPVSVGVLPSVKRPLPAHLLCMTTLATSTDDDVFRADATALTHGLATVLSQLAWQRREATSGAANRPLTATALASRPRTPSSFPPSPVPTMMHQRLITVPPLELPVGHC